MSDEEQAIDIENTLKLLECVGSINIEKYAPPKNDEDAFIEPFKKEISARPIVTKKKKKTLSRKRKRVEMREQKENKCCDQNQDDAVNNDLEMVFVLYNITII